MQQFAFRTSSKCFLSTYYILLNGMLSRSLRRSEPFLWLEVTLSMGECFGQRLRRNFSVPQAVSYEDIPLRHLPSHFNSASNSQLITPTQDHSTSDSMSRGLLHVISPSDRQAILWVPLKYIHPLPPAAQPSCRCCNMLICYGRIWRSHFELKKRSQAS